MPRPSSPSPSPSPSPSSSSEAAAAAAASRGGGGSGGSGAGAGAGLSRTFRMSVILVSALMMLVVFLCIFIVLPHSSAAAVAHSFPAEELDSIATTTTTTTTTKNNNNPIPAPRHHYHHLHLHLRKDEIPSPAAAPLIDTACKATLLPRLCRVSLLSLPASASAPSLLSIIDLALGLSRSQLLSCASLSDALLRSPLAASSLNLTDAASICSYLLARALHFHGKAAAVPFSEQQPWQVADSQAWMSAALTYENDCRSALSYVNVSASVGELMAQVSYAINLTSNALGMIGAMREHGGDGEAWAPSTRLSLYRAVPPPPPPPPASGGGGDGSFLSWWGRMGATVAGATVAKDGSGDYATVQAAVDAAPEVEGDSDHDDDGWHVIRVKEGVYEEIVRVPWGEKKRKKRMAMVGEGMGRSVITGSLNAQMPGLTTYDTATVAVDADGFAAVGMTFENTAGPAKHQAVALRVDGDMAAFYNCSVLGHQDTLYAHALRQLYSGCRVEGTVDFVFGNAAAVLERCEVAFRPGLPGAATSMATAQGRTDPAQATGLVLDRCDVDGTAAFRRQLAAGGSRAYLGRPWKLFSRTVLLGCTLPDFLQPDGWLPWNGDFALSTLFYAEFNDSGPGARPASSRVPWSQQLDPGTAALFAPVPFIQADRWLPPAPRQ